MGAFSGKHRRKKKYPIGRQRKGLAIRSDLNLAMGKSTKGRTLRTRMWKPNKGRY